MRKRERSSITLQGPLHPARQLASRISIEVLHKPTAGLLYSCFAFVGESVAVPQEHIKVSAEGCQRRAQNLCLGQIFNTKKTTLSLFAHILKQEKKAGVKVK